MQSFKKRILLLFLTLFLACTAVVLFAGKIYVFPKDQYPEASLSSQIDVILCLSGGSGRFQRAVELWGELKRQNPHLYLYIAGMGPKSNFNDFLRQIPENRRGIIDESRVILEKESTTTKENVSFFVPRMTEYQWKSVALVTSSYHIKRSYMLLSKSLSKDSTVYIDPVPSERFNEQNWMDSLYGVRVTLEEFFKGLVTQFI